MNVVIIEYGIGNIGSIANMFKKMGLRVAVTCDLDIIAAATHLILPGIGSFDAGMKKLQECGVIKVVEMKVLQEKTPILGICLGMHLLTNSSEEGTLPGLGWIDAETRRFRFDDSNVDWSSLQIPHVRWNEVRASEGEFLFEGYNGVPRYYFMHSYYVCCREPSLSIGKTVHGYEFTSAVRSGNVMGVQFHPEKSHWFGMKFLENFVGNAKTPRGFRQTKTHTISKSIKRTRVIPSLLLKHQGFYKTEKFQNPIYLGDPINILKIFNDKRVDEICVLDIGATLEGTGPQLKYLMELASECFVPLAYGGNITNMRQVQKILKIGVEKCVFNSAYHNNPNLIKNAVNEYGAQSVVVSIDVKKGVTGEYGVYTCCGGKRTGRSPRGAALDAEDLRAGEILLNSIDRDGTMSGYDLALIEAVCSAVSIPVIIRGGAGSIDDLSRAARAGASAVGVGAFFVFTGHYRSVLINVPSSSKLESTLP